MSTGARLLFDYVKNVVVVVVIAGSQIIDTQCSTVVSDSLSQTVTA